MPTLVLCLLFLPLATAVVVALLGTGERSEAAPPPHGEGEGGHTHARPFGRADLIRWLSLASTLACLVLALIVAVTFAGPRVRAGGEEPPAGQLLTFHPEMVTRWDLLPLRALGGGEATIQFYLGVDGLNVWLVLLTALLLVPSVLISWTA